ncbi:MAG: tetratricopeptide repeat protein, partial [Burkholderiales bacterium]
MFWPISFALLLAGALVTLWPLLSRDSSWKWSAMAGVVLLPLAGYGLYQGIGTPEALSQPAAEPLSASSTEMPGAEDMNQLVDQLRQRLQDNPEELQGWLLLGRSYKTLQNYRLAVEALETASRLAPDQP